MGVVVPESEVGTVEFVLVWDKDEKTAKYKHKYEITLGQFDDHTEILRMLDGIGGLERNAKSLKKLSSEWMRIHAILASRGFLKGK